MDAAQFALPSSSASFFRNQDVADHFLAFSGVRIPGDFLLGFVLKERITNDQPVCCTEAQYPFPIVIHLASAMPSRN